MDRGIARSMTELPSLTRPMMDDGLLDQRPCTTHLALSGGPSSRSSEPCVLPAASELLWRTQQRDDIARQRRARHAASWPVSKRQQDEQFLPLRRDTPAWWSVPASTLEACDAFDRAHHRLWAGSEAALLSVCRQTSRRALQRTFDARIAELRRHRYNAIAPEAVVPRIMKPEAAARKQPPKQWSLEESIWAPRASWCDALAFYDTETCNQRMLEVDFERARAHGLSR